MPFFKSLINVSAIPPVNGSCDPKTTGTKGLYYAGCMNNGQLSYVCSTAGYKKVGEACWPNNPSIASSCQGTQSVSCAGIKPIDPNSHGGGGGADPTAYCECRTEICNKYKLSGDCAPHLNPNVPKGAIDDLQNCCRDIQDPTESGDCLTFEHQDSIGFDPCSQSPSEGCDPPCSSDEICQGNTCVHKNTPPPPPPSDDYCNWTKNPPTHTEWTDKDKQCFFNGLTSKDGGPRLSGNIAHCIVKNIVEKYNIQQLIKAKQNNDTADIENIINTCSTKKGDYDGHFSRSCNTDKDCPDEQACNANKICKEKGSGLSTAAIIGLCIAAVAFLLFLFWFFVIHPKRKQRKQNVSLYK